MATQPKTWHPLPRLFRHLAASTPQAVLLESANETGKTLLFLNPTETLTATEPHELDQLLRQMDQHISQGKYAAGYFSYECGEHFADLPPRPTKTDQLAWLGIFEEPIIFDHTTGQTHGSLPEDTTPPEQTQAEIKTNGLEISQADYNAALAKINQYLHAGDTYQVNFTDRVLGTTEASPLALYETLLQQQPVPYAAFANLPTAPLLSFSPELFFNINADRITVRPMKGTWPRGINNAADEQAAQHLRNDEKNRAEHVMIVDLLRNDLGRICEFGSVTAEQLFHVERYNTLFQMTSTCTGQLRPGWTPSQVLTNLFPSGSITGAPKRRTMEIIRELERHPRGPYTGAIGYFAPAETGSVIDRACFNVAIRTVTLAGDQLNQLTMGVGGGITADSNPAEEFAECQLKAAFLTQRRPKFSLIETMRCEVGIIPLLPLHLNRLAASAQYFGIRYNAAKLEAELTATSKQCGDTLSRVRMELHQAGNWTITAAPLDNIPWQGRLLLSTQTTNAANIFLHHKTTNRALYENALKAARAEGFDEVLFVNEQGQITECAVSNIFAKIEGKWVTPKLQSGALPGVQRTAMLQEQDTPAASAQEETPTAISEQDLKLEDLARATSIYTANALRGPRKVHSITTTTGQTLYSSNHSPKLSC